MLTPREERVPGYRVERLIDSIRRFRKAWSRYHRPQDVNHLLHLFPSVTLPLDYMLDYLPMGGETNRWIWPYARRQREHDPPEALASLARDYLVGERDTGALRPVVVETLYNYLQYEKNPRGLLEYAFFVSELWATKSESVAREWLSLEPLFSKRSFEAVLRKAGASLLRVARPTIYDPVVVADPEGGGTVRFLVYNPGDWKRIYYLVCRIDPEGEVKRQAGDLVANLGGRPRIR